MAKKSFHEEFEQYLSAGFPILHVETLENGRILRTIRAIADRHGMTVTTWLRHSGLRNPEGALSAKCSLREALDVLFEDRAEISNHIIVLEDVTQRVEDDPESEAEVSSRLRHFAEIMELDEENGGMDNAMIVLLAPIARIPREIEPYVTLMSEDILGVEEIKDKIVAFLATNDERPPVEELLVELARALCGLAEIEITNTLSLAYTDGGDIDRGDLPLIRAQKQQMIKKSGLLEMVEANERMEDIGGLEELKQWLLDKAVVFKDAERARKYGVEIPKGVLIAGMPGCGKSLTAKAAARAFGLPLMRMDMGRLMGKYVGESEGNMHRALTLTEASSPCILWIDELGKAFSGVQAGGGGSEITTRLFGNFLTWMQEKKSSAFVVATANNISNLPPELLRKGRFDEIFYVDLPNPDERRKILEVHIKKRRKSDFPDIALDCLVSETEGYCGADLEGVVRESVERAFVRRKEALETEELLETIKETHPIRETMKESIEHMAREYETKKLRPASRK